jgi:branched-subunit amino acid transport protein
VTLWVAILAAAAVSMTFKAAGPAVLGERELPAAARNVIALMAPALLAALIVIHVGGPRWAELNWPMVAGLAATAVAWLLRAPLLVAAGAGVVVAALIRVFAG